MRYRQRCHIVYENKEHKQAEIIVPATNIGNRLEYLLRRYKNWCLGDLVQCSYALIGQWVNYGIRRGVFDSCPYLPPKKEKNGK